MTDRRRNSVILLLVAILIGLATVTIVAKKTRLGLDLKGGVQLVYEGRPTGQAKVDTESLNRAIDIMRKRVDQLGVASPEIQRSGEKEIVVQLPEVTNIEKAERQVGTTAQLQFYDWEPNVIGPEGTPAPTEASVTGGREAGGSAFGLTQYKAVQRALKRAPELRHNDTTWDWHTNCTPAQVNGCLYGSWYLIDEKNQQMLCPLGPHGETQTTCSAAESEKAVRETEHQLISKGKMPKNAKPKAVRVNPGTVLIQARQTEGAGGKVLNRNPNSFFVIKDDPVLTGADITHPQQGFDEGAGGNGQPNVNFGFTGHGKSVFEGVTKNIAHRGQEAQLPGVPKTSAEQHFAVGLDGKLVTTPSIDYTKYPEGIDSTNGSEISGGFTIGSAQELAEELQSGALPIKLNLISRSQVSATLGKQALNQGLIALLVGFLLVCVFLVAFYRILGLIAVGGLVIYGIYFFALIKLIPITLTLPGIAGLILTIGVAADANIVIFERVKEEIRGGRSVVSGIATGYKRGFAAIVDANVVTFMTAFILFALATAEVKGFAFTLGIGVLVSLFTAVLATQAVLGAMARSKLVTHPAALGAKGEGHKWTFDFMGASKWFFSFSGVILLIGALAIGGKGLNFGIDFKSGTRIQTGFQQKISEARVADEMTKLGFPNAEVQKYSNASVGGNGFQISTKTLRPTKVNEIEKGLAQFQPRHFSSTSIGPTFGKTIAKSAVIAIIASLLVISAYIALRFQWKYSVPVLIALMHDLLITAGVYSLTGREVTTATVAALLTILGYSLYDTIIVFDRVRENVPRMPRAAFSQIVNRSMSEVLTRSLATTFCTLLPVLSLLAFGGETLKDFAFALMIGIASGAYSSIFIASPVLTHWKEREPGYRARRARLERETGGLVPAYATTAAGAPEDVEPDQKTGRRRRGRLTAPEDPEQRVSREEFQELVADIQEDETGKGRAPVATKAPPEPEPEPEPEPQAERDPSADLTPEDLVLKDKPKPRQKRPKNRRHGRSR